MKLLVLTPTRDPVCEAYLDTYVALYAACLARRIELVKQFDKTPGMTDHSRNILLHVLATSDADWGLWWDSDTSFHPFLAIDLLHKEEEFICRGYPIRSSVDMQCPPEAYVDLLKGRSFDRNWAIFPKLNGNEFLWNEERDMVRIDGCGFGWVLMRPSAARKMLDVYGTCAPDWLGKISIPAFDRIANWKGHLCAEDISFCERFAKIGGEMWCAPSGYITNGPCGGNYLEEMMRIMKQAPKIGMGGALEFNE